MKKILSVLLAVLMLVTAMSAISTVSAEEFEYPLVPEETYDKYWRHLYEPVVKVGDWYYYLNDDGYIFGVCGYGGNETEITIPTEIDGCKIKTIEGFYLLSDTVKTIKIPKEITMIRSVSENTNHVNFSGNTSYFRFNKTTNFEEIIVDSENEKFSSRDGVLFSKGEGILYFYPPKKIDNEYVVPSTVWKIEEGAIWYPTHLKSLTIPQSVKYIYENSIIKSLEELYFDNTNDIIGDTIEQIGIDPDRVLFEGPKIPRGTIYCIYGTPLYKYYNKSWNQGYFYKELKVIPRKGDETLIKEDGVWYYYDNGAKTNRSTLVKYSGKWFYVSDGIWDKTVDDIIIGYKDKAFYIKNGTWSSDINTLKKQGGNWLHIKNGKWDGNSQDLVKYEGKWFFATKGKWDKTVDTLFKKNGKWFAIKSGKWYKDKAIIKYSGKKFYVNKGFVQFDYSGNVKVNGKTYKIKNGKVA